MLEGTNVVVFSISIAWENYSDTTQKRERERELNEIKTISWNREQVHQGAHKCTSILTDRREIDGWYNRWSNEWLDKR